MQIHGCEVFITVQFLFVTIASPVFDIITTVFCYIVTIHHLFTQQPPPHWLATN